MQTENIVSTLKFGLHENKINEYLQNEPIWPITLELDLTTACSRTCPGCATVARPSVQAMDKPFIQKLLDFFVIGTKGMLLGGGEPTLAHTFGYTLQYARRVGFENIGVITNGAHLDNEKVYIPLINYASCIRVSINNANPHDYGQSFGCDPSELPRILKSISTLRKRIDEERSPLQIGVATLTSDENYDQLEDIVTLAKNAGAHWLYFHPFCKGWEVGLVEQAEQIKSYEFIKSIIQKANDFKVFTFEDRYFKENIDISFYHAAYFLMMICGDKKIYLGPETKYNSKYEIYDLSDWDGSNFLADPNLKNKIASFNYKTYPAIRSNSRSILYSKIIEKMRNHPDYKKEFIQVSSKNNFDSQHIHLL